MLYSETVAPIRSHDRYCDSLERKVVEERDFGTLCIKMFVLLKGIGE